MERVLPADHAEGEEQGQEHGAAAEGRRPSRISPCGTGGHGSPSGFVLGVESDSASLAVERPSEQEPARTLRGGLPQKIRRFSAGGGVAARPEGAPPPLRAMSSSS